MPLVSEYYFSKCPAALWVLVAAAAPIPACIALTYHIRESRQRRSQKVQQWRAAADGYLQRLRHERDMCRERSTFRVDRGALGELLEAAERVGVSTDDVLRVAVAQEIANSLVQTECVRDDTERRIRDGDDDEGEDSSESMIERFPEVISRLDQTVQTSLKQQIALRKRARRYSLLRYYITRSSTKAAVYCLVIGVAVMRTRIRMTTSETIVDVTEALLLSSCRDGCTSDTAQSVLRILLQEAVVESFEAVCEGFVTRLTQAMTERYRNEQKALFYDALIRKDTSYFDLHTPDDIEAISYYINDLEGVDTQLHFHLMKLVSTVAKLYYLAQTSPACGAAVAVVSLIGTYVVRSVRTAATTIPTRREEAATHSSASSDLGGTIYASDVFENIRLLRSLGAERTLIQSTICSLTGPTNDEVGKDRRSVLLRNCFYAVSSHSVQEGAMITARWVTHVSTLSQVWLAACLLRSSPTHVRRFVETVHDVVGHMNVLRDIINLIDTNAYKACVLERIMDNVGRRGDDDDDVERKKGNPFSQDIVIDSVCFAYPTRPERNVLTNVSAVIPRGKLTVIRGENGCGKSTLALLLMRLYDPACGTIRAAMSCSARAWRSHIGYVPQHTVVFPGTVDFNIRCGRVTFAPEDVARAARRAGAMAYIEELPERFYTRLGAKHLTLSGGQCQRLGICRALLHDPQVLILDEPTSALDTASSDALLSMLRDVVDHDGITVVVVSHCENVMAAADHIIEL